MGPEVMIAANVASAALKAGVEYAEKNKPSPEETFRWAKIELLEEQANGGDVDAQYAMGIYYQATREARARHWICRAAAGGHPRAQLQYGHWYNEDRNREDLWPFIGISPDNREAWRWYSLAAENGEIGALHHIERLEVAGLDRQALEQGQAGRVGSPASCGVFTALRAPGAPAETSPTERR
jgi:TPR repeat protein